MLVSSALKEGQKSRLGPFPFLNTVFHCMVLLKFLLFIFQGVRIHAVQCANNSHADDFYQSLAEMTKGMHLKLQKLEFVVDVLHVICCAEHLGLTLGSLDKEF